MADVEQPLLQRQNSRTSQPGLARQLSHHSIPDSEAHENKHGRVETNIRNQFIKKVYSILTVQLLWTAAICAFFMFYQPLREATILFVNHHALLWQVMIFVSLLGSICALMMKKNEYPTNYKIMFVFISVMACNIAVPCAFYYAAGKGLAIAQAVLVTGVIFLTLTAYAHFSKTDFSFIGGFLMCVLMCNIIFGLIAILSGSSMMVFMYHVFGVLVFCGFILMDTAMLIHKYGCDDYMIASIELYLDVINLFLHILALLGNR